MEKGRDFYFMNKDKSPLIDKSLSILLKHYIIGTQGTDSEIKSWGDHKLRHTIGVLDSGNRILDLLKKTEEIRFFIENLETKVRVACILHDLGRFYQNNGKDKILKDNFDKRDGKIFNHGDFSYQIAKKEGFSEDICLALKYHNRKDINLLYQEDYYKNLKTDEEKNELEFLVKITRDADKLANMIYYVNNPSRISPLDKDKKGNNINSEIIEKFKKNIYINVDDVKSSIDKILFQYAFLFDINIKKESFKILEEEGYFEKMKKILFNKINTEKKVNYDSDIKKLNIIDNSVKKYIDYYK